MWHYSHHPALMRVDGIQLSNQSSKILLTLVSVDLYVLGYYPECGFGLELITVSQIFERA